MPHSSHHLGSTTQTHSQRLSTFSLSSSFEPPLIALGVKFLLLLAFFWKIGFKGILFFNFHRGNCPTGGCSLLKGNNFSSKGNRLYFPISLGSSLLGSWIKSYLKGGYHQIQKGNHSRPMPVFVDSIKIYPTSLLGRGKAIVKTFLPPFQNGFIIFFPRGIFNPGKPQKLLSINIL